MTEKEEEERRHLLKERKEENVKLKAFPMMKEIDTNEKTYGSPKFSEMQNMNEGLHRWRERWRRSPNLFRWALYDINEMSISAISSAKTEWLGEMEVPGPMIPGKWVPWRIPGHSFWSLYAVMGAAQRRKKEMASILGRRKVYFQKREISHYISSVLIMSG